MFFSTYQR